MRKTSYEEHRPFFGFISPPHTLYPVRVTGQIHWDPSPYPKIRLNQKMGIQMRALQHGILAAGRGKNVFYAVSTLHQSRKFWTLKIIF